MKIGVVVLPVAVVLLAASACTRGGAQRSGLDRPPCQPGDEQAGLVAERLAGGVSLREARAVRLDPPVDNYFYVVAAEIDGPGLEVDGLDVDGDVGVWGVGSWLGGARIMALDANARRWSDWGAAIPSRSPAGKQRARMAARPEVDRARACVGQPAAGTVG